MKKLLVAGFALALSFTGCAHPGSVPLQARPILDEAALSRAVTAFYTATSAVDLKSAVRSAERAAPDSAAYHELAAELAMLEADTKGRFQHLTQALTDLSNKDARLHLESLLATPWTIEERRAAKALLESLADRHPDPELRAAAASQLALLSHHEGDLRAADRWLARTGLRLPFAIVGAWDNDQGKGFDSPLPPEATVSMDAKYDGVLGEIGWRKRPPRELGSDDLNLGSILYPNQWAIAYATAVVELDRDMKVELRLRSSSPLRVFVDGREVLGVRNISGRAFDQLVVPIEIPKGKRRILIKSASERGSWRLGGRLTCEGAMECTGLHVLPPEVEVDAPAMREIEPLTDEALIAARIAHVPEGPRRAALAVLWAKALGLYGPAVTAADAYLAKADRSIYGGYFLATSLWDRGERDRTADLLDTLDRIAGKELPVLALQHARFASQEGLARRARKIVTELIDRDPKLAEGHRLLAQLHEKEGWREDQCASLDEAIRLRPGWLDVEQARATCLDSIGFDREAADIRRGILEVLPFDSSALGELISDAEAADRLSEAEAYATTLVEAFPSLPWTWLRLAEIRRRAHDIAGARAAIARAKSIAPDAPRAYEVLGTLAYQTGLREEAIQEWQIALTKNPEDEKLSNRLAFLAPSGKETWEKDVPSEDDIEAHIAAGKEPVSLPGANTRELLDHQVTRIHADGSSSHYVTLISRALNESGRDQLTQQEIPAGGRFRIIHAFAVDASGRRIQASSIRGRTVRYRSLSVGATVVLQFRLDQGSRPYLARHYAEDWWFQGPASARRISNWIIWAPKDSKFHESVKGQNQACPEGFQPRDGADSCFVVERTQDVVGSEVRVSFLARDIPPLVGEPNMPPVAESMFHLSVSTVPSWDDYLKWEEALIEDVFRDSPELIATADRVTQGATTTIDKLYRIQAYLMQDVRYQQDYEDTIAGVKPHAAPVVIERAYGDCKDKAVLFIALARRHGIDVHYALLRNRTAGALDRDVPMQQFNHAIVYVPAQEGLAEGRFFDPTADQLDVDVLRDDDPGAIALVLDPKSKKHEFIPIPYQAPTAHSQKFESSVELDTEGRAVGQFAIVSRGRFGQLIRNLSRNEQQLAQGTQYFMGTLFSGARVHEQRPVEVQDLTKPSRLEIAFEAPGVARLEGSELRFSPPSVWSPQGLFQLAERRFPLVLGAPYVLESTMDFWLPEGSTLKRVPDGIRVESECFVFERKFDVKGRRVSATQSFVTKCERISVESYRAHREKAEEVTKSSRDEVVANLGKAI